MRRIYRNRRKNAWAESLAERGIFSTLSAGQEREDPLIAVHVVAPDRITGNSIASLLDQHPSLDCVPAHRADVVVVVDDVFLPSTMGRIQDSARFDRPIVLLAGSVRTDPLLTLISHGVVAVLDTATTSDTDLTDAVLAAAHGEGLLPHRLMGPLLRQVRDLQRYVLSPLGYTSIGLSNREVQILRLLADGLETREIAAALAYSESTVKKDLHVLISRFNLRNRTQAVAFAIRAGVL
jgi:DNA-binding NarL/FixJ family response regulator